MTRETENQALSRQRLRLWLEMPKAVRSVEGILRENLREDYATTLPRFSVLAALHAEAKGMKMSELSKYLIVSNGNITGVVDRLAAEGLVERETLESDRRAFLVQITPKGRKLMDDMILAHLGWVDSIFADVTEADAARGISIMLDVRGRA